MDPRIVVLDGYTLNPGDIGWQPFEALGKLTVHDRSADEQIVARAESAPFILTNKTPVTASTMDQLKDLRYIGVMATGTNVVDLQAAAERDITVTNVPGYGAESVAQHAFAMLLELANHVAAHDKAVREGAWSTCEDFCFTVAPITELAGKTMGIIGLGAIGKRVARMASGAGMKIASVARPDKPQIKMHGIPIDWYDLDELFTVSDVLTLHCPLTEQTHHMVNAKRLASMKPTAFLINTGRGPLIDEQALADALAKGQPAAAACDVLSVEPPKGEHANNPLLKAPNCIITPHIAWASIEARKRLMGIAANNLKQFIANDPINTVHFS